MQAATEVHQCSTHMTLHKHTDIDGSPEYLHGPSAHPAPLPGSSHSDLPYAVPNSPAGSAGCLLQTCSTHTLIPQAPHTRESRQISAWTLCPSDTPAVTWDPSTLAVKSSLQFANKYPGTPNAHPVWGDTDTHTRPADDTPLSCFSHQLWASHSPHTTVPLEADF